MRHRAHQKRRTNWSKKTVGIAITGSTEMLVTTAGELRGITIERRAVPMGRYDSYITHINEMQAAIRRGQEQLKTDRLEGRSDDWVRRRKQEVAAQTRSAIEAGKDRGRQTYIHDRVENQPPTFADWQERVYYAQAVAQDVAGLSDAASLVRYYRQHAGKVSPAARQEFDRVVGGKLVAMGEAEAQDFAQVRRLFVTPLEALYEDREAELIQLGDVLGSVEDWADIAMKELEQQGSTKIDLAAMFDQYMSSPRASDAPARVNVAYQAATQDVQPQ